MKQPANGQKVHLIILRRTLPQQVASQLTRLHVGSFLLLVRSHDDQLKTLSQPLRNQLFENFIGAQRLLVGAARLSKVRVDAVGNQAVQRHHVVHMQSPFVREIVRRDGQTGWYSQGLPIDSYRLEPGEEN